MQRTFLKTKLHRATVTAADLAYEGSVTIDRTLCREAGLVEYEQVDIYDITNGARITTYVIYGGPGEIQINGAAAHLIKPGDLVIIAAYCTIDDADVPAHRPTVVLLEDKNRIKAVHHHVVQEP